MANDDLLQEVPETELPEVLNALEKEWPKHLIFHQLVSVLKDNKNVNVQNPVQTLYRSGDITDGVYLLCSTFCYEYNKESAISVCTTSPSLTHLTEVLSETSRIPWHTKDYYIALVPSHMVPMVDQVVQSKGVHSLDKFVTLWLPPEVTVDYGELPHDVSLRYLDDSHVPEINSTWPHKYPGSDCFLSIQLKTNFGLGLFRKSDNRMLSSAISWHCGGIFVLYSDPKFRGRGYAKIIIHNMIKELRQRGRIPYGNVYADNRISMNLFKKLGFREVDTICYFRKT